MWSVLWYVGIGVIVLPLVLSLISVFMMMTYRATEEESFDDGSWGEDADVDQLAKRRYSSDT